MTVKKEDDEKSEIQKLGQALQLEIKVINDKMKEMAEAAGREKGKQQQKHNNYNDAPKCANCGKKGHYSRDCRRRNNGANNNMECWTCGKKGHVAKHCRGGAQSARPQANVVCEVCSKPGHHSAACWYRERRPTANYSNGYRSQNQDRPRSTQGVTCQLCGRQNHEAGACRQYRCEPAVSEKPQPKNA